MRPLAWLIALHLFAVSLLPGGDAQALCELPTLWAHHQADHAGASFWSFFYDHYLGEHKGRAEHQALPGHHAPTGAAQVADMPPPEISLETPAPLPVPGAARTFARLVSTAPTRAGTGLWQPPRA